MNKDRVVIEDGGMRYVMQQIGNKNRSCRANGCELYTGCGADCENEHRNVFMFCSGAYDKFEKNFTCISATKIEPEPKMYFAWNREEARHLVWCDIHAHSGNVTSDGPVTWFKTVLHSIGNTGAPFHTKMGYVPIIREIPKIEMTISQLREQYGVPDNVVIVEGE